MPLAVCGLDISTKSRRATEDVFNEQNELKSTLLFDFMIICVAIIILQHQNSCRDGASYSITTANQ